MVMSIKTTDSLVSRLLQQQARHQTAPETTTALSSNKADQVSISSQARQHQNHENLLKQQELESQLLRLYTQHDIRGRQP